MFLFCFKQDKKLIKKVSVTLRVNYQGVLEFVSGSFEILSWKPKRFENFLKLPEVLFSISLIIYRRHIEKVGEPLTNAVKYTNNKKAIEYIYTENIPNSAIEVVGTSSAKTTTKEIFQELTAGKPEAKHLWQI